MLESRKEYSESISRKLEEEKSEPILNESQEESVINEDTTMDIEKGSFIDTSKTIADEE